MIEIKGLTKTFVTGFLRKKAHVLKGVDLSVQRGEIFGFLGPNGAGKTTTLKVLMGLIYADSGTATIMGEPAGDVRSKMKVGFLPEQPYLYSYLTASEVLDFYGRLFGIPASERGRRATELLGHVGLSHAGHTQLRKFSKGMLQRIGIAQALINDPELVILDEPMSGLDPVGRREVRDIILGLRDEGKTVFFSTHILPDVEVVCDRVGILADGRVKSTGSVGELLDELGTGSVEMSVTGLGAAGLEDLKRRSKGSIERGHAVIFFFGGQDEASEAAGFVYQSGGRIISMTPQRRSLEDIFLEEVSTGRGQG